MQSFDRFIFLLLLLGIPVIGHAQADPESQFAAAHIEKKTIAELDISRPVTAFDATPNGSLWFAVDQFALLSEININGKIYPTNFNEIPGTVATISPNDRYLIWMGLHRAITDAGFDSTVVSIYRDTNLLGMFVSDFPTLEFSRTGEHWAALLPYAFQQQQGERDVAFIDGSLMLPNQDNLRQFSFSHDETKWAFRTTTGTLEKLITPAGEIPLYHKSANMIGQNATWDPTIWHYTPDVTFNHKFFEGRDYSFNWEHVATLNRTSFSKNAADTVRTYVSYEGHNHGLYRWITNLQIDSSGKHIVYFACDPAQFAKGKNGDERKGIVVYDGKAIAGPFDNVGKLFLSPSGKRYAFSTSPLEGDFYEEKKRIATHAKIVDCIWSRNEDKLAWIEVGSHGRFFVVADGKRSPLFERIGRVGFTKNGVEYLALTNGHLLEIKQSF